MRQYLRILSLAFEYKKKRTLKDDLCAKIKTVRNYLVAARNGYYDNQNSWDCGRQDAFGDKVDQMFTEFEALKIAWDLENGNTKRFNRIAKLIGEY